MISFQVIVIVVTEQIIHLVSGDVARTHPLTHDVYAEATRETITNEEETDGESPTTHHMQHIN